MTWNVRRRMLLIERLKTFLMPVKREKEKRRRTTTVHHLGLATVALTIRIMIYLHQVTKKEKLTTLTILTLTAPTLNMIYLGSGVAQLVERLRPIQEVRSSNPGHQQNLF